MQSFALCSSPSYLGSGINRANHGRQTEGKSRVARWDDGGENVSLPAVDLINFKELCVCRCVCMQSM